MAKAKLKTTDALGKMDAKQLAEMLRRMGRRGDTVLAHITPREAKKLKEQGGSGTINPKTGLPEFFDGFDFGGDFGGYNAATQAVADYGDFSSPEFQQVLDTYSSDYGATPEAYDTSGYYFDAVPQQVPQMAAPPVADYAAPEAAYYTPTYAPQPDYAAPQDAAYDPYSLGYGLEQALFQQPVTGAGEFTYAGPGAPQTFGGDLRPLAAKYGDFTSPEFQQVLQAYGGPAGRTAEMYDMTRASELSEEDRRSLEEGLKQTEEERTTGRGVSALSGLGGGLLNQLLSGLSLAGLARLGLTGAAAAAARRQQQQAIKQAEQAAQTVKGAYGTAAQDLRSLAAPIQGPAITALTQAQQGALDPARLRQLEIERARLAQAAAKTGGVGAIQSAEAMNRARQDALTAQQSAAVSLLGQANPLLTQAIQAQLQGTTQGLAYNLQLQQQANQAAANLYGQLGRYMAG